MTTCMQIGLLFQIFYKKKSILSKWHIWPFCTNIPNCALRRIHCIVNNFEFRVICLVFQLMASSSTILLYNLPRQFISVSCKCHMVGYASNSHTHCSAKLSSEEFMKGGWVIGFQFLLSCGWQCRQQKCDSHVGSVWSIEKGCQWVNWGRNETYTHPWANNKGNKANRTEIDSHEAVCEK